VGLGTRRARARRRAWRGGSRGIKRNEKRRKGPEGSFMHSRRGTRPQPFRLAADSSISNRFSPARDHGGSWSFVVHARPVYSRHPAAIARHRPPSAEGASPSPFLPFTFLTPVKTPFFVLLTSRRAAIISESVSSSAGLGTSESDYERGPMIDRFEDRTQDCDQGVLRNCNIW